MGKLTTVLAKIGFLVLALIVSSSAKAASFDWSINGHVTRVESTYVPLLVTFVVDQGAGSCPAGTMLTYKGGSTFTNPADPNLPANIKANFAALLAASVSGNQVSIYGMNSGCTVQFIHSTNGR